MCQFISKLSDDIFGFPPFVSHFLRIFSSFRMAMKRPSTFAFHAVILGRLHGLLYRYRYLLEKLILLFLSGGNERHDYLVEEFFLLRYQLFRCFRHRARVTGGYYKRRKWLLPRIFSIRFFTFSSSSCSPFTISMRENVLNAAVLSLLLSQSTTHS